MTSEEVAEAIDKLRQADREEAHAVGRLAGYSEGYAAGFRAGEVAGFLRSGR